MKILRIAIPAPLRRLFDYLPNHEARDLNIQPGTRVRVSFQNRNLVGIFVGWAESSDIPIHKLKPIQEVIDTTPVLTPDILSLCQWGADYYHHPIGEVLANALPILIRQGKPADYAKEAYYYLSELGKSIDVADLKRTPRQADAINLFSLHPEGFTAKQLKQHRITNNILHTLQEKKLVFCDTKSSAHTIIEYCIKEKFLPLNTEQQAALDAIKNKLNTFQVFLLDGVTGSGKTEIYLQAIVDILQQNKQALVLVPEIGLTPQTIQRFRERFTVPVIALHSGLSEKERLNAWLAAKEGDAKIIIGTRSAVFTPFANLGLIIIDEEHDLSFKQQDGFRYHARDVAIMRAHHKNIPVILGSATPALESLQNAHNNRFEYLSLPYRAGNAILPAFKILDIRKSELEEGLSNALLAEMKTHLANGNQVMLFLNRRGYAPVLMCHSCGWLALCKRCDIRMTLHQAQNHLHCHHCDSRRGIPQQCDNCHEKNLTPIGLGTERLEIILEKYFPQYAIARIDRDSTQRKGKMEEMLLGIQQGTFQILIGTQMLAKGHHFPNVTLVAIIDADSGFFSADFRALERMGQLILQVAGRAGRVEKPGTVLIQTHHPDHPALHQLIHENYNQFAVSLLEERKQALLPPYRFFALFRADAHSADQARLFLQDVKKLLPLSTPNLQILGPIPAPMPKRAGKHRAQLLLQAKHRPQLQQLLKNLLLAMENTKGKQRVRWSLDVDPLEMF